MSEGKTWTEVGHHIFSAEVQQNQLSLLFLALVSEGKTRSVSLMKNVTLQDTLRFETLAPEEVLKQGQKFELANKHAT